MSTESRTPWVPLPTFPPQVRLLGPTPAEAMVAVEPFLAIDKPYTAIQTLLAGWCDAAGQLVEPLEVDVVIEPSRTVPDRQVPLAAALHAHRQGGALAADLPAVPGFDWLRGFPADATCVGPLLFCRRTRKLFLARGRATHAPLAALPADAVADGDVVGALVSCEIDGGRPVRCYAGVPGSVAGETIESLEQLLVDQGHVVAAARERGEPGWVCQCEDCGEIDADDSDYKAALDRLVVVHAAPAPLIIRPHGEWSFSEACGLIGGRGPDTLLGDEKSAYHAWRRRHAARMSSTAPSHLLADERDGRNLLEVLRVKLGLLCGAFEQLERAWSATGRPHLAWDDEAIRVAWRDGDAVPATVWGLRPILRRVGRQPAAELGTVDGVALPYPPAFSDPHLVLPAAAEACRYWGESRPANVFVKTAKDADGGQDISVLLEGLGIDWQRFELADAVHVTGKDWQAVLSPCAERDPNDGEGLPFAGRATGAALKVGEDYPGAEVRWYPRCGEALDLHALAALACRGLLATDEREDERFFEALHADVAALRKSLGTLAVEQREAFVLNWVTERAEQDAPANVWTRRNLLHDRVGRGTTSLDGLPAPLWQACVLWLLRMLTCVEGFGYCEDRTAAAPRAGDLLLPLAELRGLLALLDDALLRRTAPGERVNDALTAEEDDE